MNSFLSVFRRVVPVALLAPAAIVVACEDSSTSGGGPTIDGGSTPNVEAGPSDPTRDAATDAPVSTDVVVTVRTFATPFKDARVIFHDANGAVVGDVKTDAAGKASFAGAAAMVTVIPAMGASPVTYLGVEAGDNLTVDLREAYRGEGQSIGEYQVTFPASVDGAFQYDALVGTCYGSSETSDPTAVTLFPPCVNGPANAVLGRAQGETGVLGFAYKKGNAFPSAGPIVLGAWAPPATLTLTATNRPEDASYTFGFGAAVADGTLFGLRGSGAIEEGGRVFEAPAAGFADAIQVAGGMGFPDGAAPITSVIIKRVPAATTAAIDLAQALPRINGASAALNGDRVDTTITPSAPIAGDGGYVTLGWVIDPESENPRYAGWTFVVPPGTNTFKTPVLPTDAAFVPAASTEVSAVAFFDSETIASYKQFKVLPATPYLGGGGQLGEPEIALPTNDTIRASLYGVTYGQLD